MTDDTCRVQMHCFLPAGSAFDNSRMLKTRSPASSPSLMLRGCFYRTDRARYPPGVRFQFVYPPEKSPEKSPRFGRRGPAGGSKLTSITSLPITSMQFHGSTMSSHLPNRPKNLGLPKITMLISLPLQVSISTSPTHPRKIPLLMQITCF